MSGDRPSRGRFGSGTRFALALLMAAALAGTVSAAVQILPLGDSITHGGDGDGGVSYPSYRAWLYQDLRRLGYDVDFVGSLDRPEPPAGSDPDNEGHSAYTAGEVLAELPAWLQTYPPPQVALVHLGTNDVIEGVASARTVEDLGSIVAVLRSRNPSMRILLAQIIPTSVASTNERIEALNDGIATLAALSTTQSPVVIVDQYTGFDGDAETQKGGVHPTTAGEKRMAAAWEGALLPILAAGVPAVPTTAPQVTPQAMPIVPAPTATVITTPTASRFGTRAYRIGANAGQTRPSGVNAGRVIAPATRARSGGSDAGTMLTPPTKSFTRWYPAARWSAGIR